MSWKRRLYNFAGGRKIVRFCLIAVVVTALSSVLSYLLLPELLELSTVFSVRGQEEYSITDFYNRLASATIDKKDAGEVLCLSYEGNSRKELATLLDSIVGRNELMPHVVALDFYFPKPNEESGQLLSSMINCAKKSRLVMPYIVEYKDDGIFVSSNSSYMNDTLAQMQDSINVSFGVINLAANYFTDVMRNFRLGFYVTDSIMQIGEDGNPIKRPLRPKYKLSMPAEMAYQKLLQEGNTVTRETFAADIGLDMFADKQMQRVIINYMTDTIFVYDAMILLDTTAQSADKRDEIYNAMRGRAVILGSLSDVKDTYITPMPDLQAGVLVHAYGADTLLAKRFVNKSNGWAWVLAVIICLLFSYVNCLATDHADSAGNSIVRIVQLITILLLVWAGYKIFSNHNYYIDFNIAVAMIATSALVFDMMNGGVWIVRYYTHKVRARKRLRRIKKLK